jgi:hypothetical protein
MKRITDFMGITALALTFGLVVFGCTSSADVTVQGKRKPEFSSFEIGDKKIDLYALLESSKESHENWKLLSVNIAKTSNDGKYIAIGSSEKILQSAIDENGNATTEWEGAGMVTILDYAGTILHRLNDEMQHRQLIRAKDDFIEQYMKLDGMINNNESRTEIEREMSRLTMYRDRATFLYDTDMGIGFLEFTPDNEYIISAPRLLKKGSPALDWIISWSLKTGEMKWSYHAGFGGIKSLELIEDGSKIKVIDMWDRVAIINTDTGR